LPHTQFVCTSLAWAKRWLGTVCRRQDATDRAARHQRQRRRHRRPR
jgi:hypothetical protein